MANGDFFLTQVVFRKYTANSEISSEGRDSGESVDRKSLALQKGK